MMSPSPEHVNDVIRAGGAVAVVRPYADGAASRTISTTRRHERVIGMRFLITGGAGFIGSHLADALLAGGHRVHVLDDLSTGSIDNVRHLKEDPRFAYTIDTCASAPVGYQ